MSGDGAAGVGTTGAGGGGVISARRIAEALDLPSPTEQQRRVIESPLEPGLVVAGAGSGKTETMASRVVWLLANGHVGVEEILGLTFTRKAAGELGVRIRARIEQLQQAGLAAVPADAFATPTVQTYNAFANGIFRDSATLIRREAESVVLTEASAWQLARRLVVESTDPRLLELGRGVDPITQAVISLSRAMSENVADPAEVVRLAGSFTGLAELPFGSSRIRKAPAAEAVAAVGALPPLVDLAVRFQEEKTRRGLVEYSDQVAFALASCERVPQVVAEHRKRFRVVLLDEYQDTSVVQTRLLSTLFGGPPVMAVGDPHQSIYGWRGASAANLARFGADFAPTGAASADVPVYALSTSWRNPASVLGAANRIVEPLTAASRIPVARLEPRPDAGDGRLDVAYEETVADEAASVAAWFADRLRQTGSDGRPRSAAMLCRSLKTIEPFTTALADRGVPFRVLGLGGLLDQPAVVDLVCVLRVLHDPTAGSELVRLLAGARWRIGTKDVHALSRVASWLMSRDHAQKPLAEEVRDGLRASVVPDEVGSVVDALDFVVDARDGHTALAGFSAEGLARLRAAGRQLQVLRSRVGLDLVDLVTVVQQELLLDIEVAANETDPLGRASLEAFTEQVAGYLQGDSAGTLGPFLAWLAEAERRDNLAPRTEEPEPGTVQILTIHGSKGLEWDVVAVPRMVEGELPGTLREKRGWVAFGALPFEFRGDSAELPSLAWRGAETQKEFAEAMEAFGEELEERNAAEQRRLAYVAITRTRSDLLLSGSFWSTQQKPRGPGAFLREIQQVGLIAPDALPEAPELEENPLEPGSARVAWPLPPLGPREARVRAASDAVADADPGAETVWTRDIDLLLAERDARARDAELVDLPTRIPASRFKDFVSDPAGVAARLRRPMPERPYRQTRLGTLFHGWVEARYGPAGTADVIDASGVELDADPTEPPVEQEDLDRLRATFEASEWASRKPEEVEVEIHMELAGQVVICKIDAVFLIDGRYRVVDWKTGRTPKDAADLELKQLQLALYRLAFAKWRGIDPDLIDAEFYFVAEGRSLKPERLYSEEDLVGLWSGARTPDASRAPSGETVG